MYRVSFSCIYRTSTGKTEVLFSLNEKLSQASSTQSACPRDHKFMLTSVSSQSLCALSRDPSKYIYSFFYSVNGNLIPGNLRSDTSPEGTPLPEKVSVQGKVIQRGECRPIVDQNYINLKRYLNCLIFIDFQYLCKCFELF